MIKICRENPLVVNAANQTKTVRGPAALLLRLLLLAPEHKVPLNAAVESIRIKESGFGNYCDQLRSDLADKRLIVRKGGDVWFAGDRDETDAAIIKTNFAQILEILGMGVDPGLGVTRLDGEDGPFDLAPGTAEEIMPLVEQIERLFNGSPALGLDRDWADYPPSLQTWAQGLNDVASYWVDLWTSIQLLTADCRLALRPGKSTGGQLVTKLLKIARTPDPVEEVWPRLLRAAEMSQNQRDRQRAWQLTAEFYGRIGSEVPHDLQQYCPPPPTRPDNIAAPHRSRPLERPLEPSHEGFDNLREMAETLGITSASTLRLRGEIVDPMQCIERTKNLLYFSGVLASKWVMDAGVRHAFDELLTKLDELPEDERDVRFLIIDPDGDAYSLLYQMRGGRLSNESVPHLKELARRHPSFKVAVVDALPSFRIVVIDEEMVSFAPYALEEERYATSKLGWEAPHVLLDPRAPYPLAEAFKLYFEERWSNARLLH